jgi:ribosomal protein L15E
LFIAADVIVTRGASQQHRPAGAGRRKRNKPARPGQHHLEPARASADAAEHLHEGRRVAQRLRLIYPGRDLRHIGGERPVIGG